MAVVTLNQFGATIFRPQAGQQITLRPLEWLQLGALAEGHLGEIMRGTDNSKPHEVERTWVLGSYDADTKMELRVTTSVFQDRRYAHIRMYVMDQPTKQGVTLGLPEWTMVTRHLVKTEELVLGMKVYDKMLVDKASENRRSTCYGCEVDAPSQRDHSCLTDDDFFTKLIEKSAREVTGPAFTVRLAAAADKAGMLLTYSPAELFDLVETYYGPSIREEASKKRIPERMEEDGEEDEEDEEEEEGEDVCDDDGDVVIVRN